MTSTLYYIIKLLKISDSETKFLKIYKKCISCLNKSTVPSPNGLTRNFTCYVHSFLSSNLDMGRNGTVAVFYFSAIHDQEFSQSSSSRFAKFEFEPTGLSATRDDGISLVLAAIV